MKLKRKMNVLICDDSERDVAALLLILDYSYGQAMELTAFYKAADALQYIQTGDKVDLCLLETRTEGMDGIALAEDLRKLGYSGAIAFVTHSDSFGEESYRVKAIDYLRKPLMPADVRRAVSRAEELSC